MRKELIYLVVWLIAIQGAFAINDLMALQGSVNTTGTKNITVTIWDDPTAGSQIYNSGTDFSGAVRNGRYDVMLGSGLNLLDLEFGKIYYLDIAINNQDLDFNGSERQQFQSNTGLVNTSSIATGAITSAKVLDGSLVGNDILDASIQKSKINSTTTWLESEIPSLSASWSGSLNASRIISSNLLNVNNSQYLQGFSSVVFFANDSALSLRIDVVNTSKASIGNCPFGQFVVNTTSLGVQCASPSGSGTVTQIDTGLGLIGGPILSTGTLTLNLTYLNSSYLNLGDQRYNESNYVSSTAGLLQTNISAINLRQSSDNSTQSAQLNLKAGFGNCPVGQVVQNTTLGGVECITPSGASYFAGLGLNLTGFTFNVNLSYFLNLFYQKNEVDTSIGNLQINISGERTSWLNSNSTQASLISGLQTDNSTQATLISNLDARQLADNNTLAITKANIGNCAVGKIVQNITATGVQCVDDQTGNTGFNIHEEYTRKIYAREAAFESITSGYNEPWIGTAISSGTTAVAVGSVNHPGTASMSTSTTASSGYAYQITGASTYLLGANYTTSVVFRPMNKTGNFTQIRFGFMDLFALIYPADGVFFNLTQISASNFRVDGHARNNNAMSNTSTNLSIVGSRWYAMNIYIRNTTLAEFRLWNETGDLIWNDTVNGNIPTATGRETSHAFVAYTGGGTTAQVIANIDFMTVAINQSIIR